ncbi:MAG TPA: cytochrome c3 family protein, partial [Rhodocyclaceae bacterium]|nr:cytochrome c3 family protein [Rhodocyclaceae bacterium]
MNTGPIKTGPRRWLPTVVLAALLGCGWIDAVIAAEAVAPPAAEPAAGASTDAAAPVKKKKERLVPVDLVLKGDAVCTRCHDESDDFPVLSIAQTKHGVGADARTPTCVSCHGESAQHLHVPAGQGGVRPLPDFPFGKKTLKDVAAHNQSCINCHQGDKLTLWLGSSHSRRDVACVQCHKLHTKSDQALSRASVSDMCMNCHTEKRA